MNNHSPLRTLSLDDRERWALPFVPVCDLLHGIDLPFIPGSRTVTLFSSEVEEVSDSNIMPAKGTGGD